MPAGMFVAQMDHSFHWLQMQSHLTIHSGQVGSCLNISKTSHVSQILLTSHSACNGFCIMASCP